MAKRPYSHFTGERTRVNFVGSLYSDNCISVRLCECVCACVLGGGVGVGEGAHFL